MRPIGNAADPSVLDRIPMDIIHMPVEILIVADQVLPEAALPNATFTSSRPAFGNPFGFFYSTRELAFDQIPTSGKICIIRRKSPNAMQMVRQNDDRFHAEGPS